MGPNDEEESNEGAESAPLPDPIGHGTPKEGCLSVLFGLLGGAGFQALTALATIELFHEARRKSAASVLTTFVVSYATNLFLTMLVTHRLLRTGRPMAGAVVLLISVVSILLGGTCAFGTYRRL